MKWNLERYRTSDNPELKAVSSIDAPDDVTVRLNLSRWDSALLGNLASYAGMMISPEAYKSHGDEWCRSHPVGTGPFKFVSWQRDVRIRYEKFNDYWQKGKPYLDGIEWVVITDPMSRLAAFKRGEIDDLSNVQPKDVKDLLASGKYHEALCDLSALAFCVIGDSGHPGSPFADVRVRRAVEYAVDKQALADTLRSASAKYATNMLLPRPGATTHTWPATLITRLRQSNCSPRQAMDRDSRRRSLPRQSRSLRTLSSPFRPTLKKWE